MIFHEPSGPQSPTLSLTPAEQALWGFLVPPSQPAASQQPTPTSNAGSGFTFSWSDFWRTLEAGVLGGVAGGLQNPGGGAASAAGSAAINPNYFQDLWASNTPSVVDIAAIVLGIILIAIAIWAVIKP